jgi:hypothetical protein
MLDSAKDILEATSKVANEKHTFTSTWQDIADNLVGRRTFTTSWQPGENRMKQLYDTTALMSGNMLAGAVNGILVSPATRWRRITVDPEELRQIEEVDLWCDYADNRLEYVLSDSRFGFAQAASEALLEIVFFGTMSTYVEDLAGHGPLFTAVPLQQLDVDVSMYGKPERTFRTYKCKARHILERWGPVSKLRVQSELEKDPEAEWDITQCCHPSREADNPKSSREFRCVYVLAERELVLSETGFFTNPWQVARWDTDPGETYGRCPGFTALSDAKMLNRMKESIIKVAERNAEPPVLAPHELVMGGVNLEPNAMNYYEPGLFTSDAVRPFMNQGDTGLSIEMLTNTQNSVRTHFLNHLIQVPTSPEMSAAQFAGIEEAVSRLLVPQLSRITNEWIDPLLTRTLDIMERSGMIPRRPEILRNKNVNVRVEYLSPAIRAQKITEARAVVGAFSDLGPIAAQRPDVFDNYDADFAAQTIASAHGVDPRMQRSAQFVQQVREMRAQQQQEAQEAQQMKEGIDQVSKLAPMLEQGMTDEQAVA